MKTITYVEPPDYIPKAIRKRYRVGEYCEEANMKTERDPVDCKMHDRVRIKETNEIAYIVWYNEENPSQDSFLLEKEGVEEMPEFYKREEFEILR